MQCLDVVIARIIGVDPATVKLGMAVIEADGERARLLDTISIVANKSASLPERLSQICHASSDVMKKWNPDLVIIESQFLKSNPHSFRLIAYSVGVIATTAILHTAAHIEIVEVKKWRTLTLGKGHGNASKEDVVDYVSRYFQIDKDSLTVDEFEAIGIALAGTKIHTGKS